MSACAPCQYRSRIGSITSTRPSSGVRRHSGSAACDETGARRGTRTARPCWHLQMRPDWLVLTGLQAVQARVRRRRVSGPRIAGILSVKDYSDACSAFDSLQALSDVTIVLDDNSSTPFPYRDRCDEYLTLSTRSLWNDVANKTLLMQRAFVHGCDWLVCMDDDIVFSHGFQTKADALLLIEEMQGRRADVAIFPLRDLWESPDAFRADGIWARKTFNVVRRNWLSYRSITMRDPGRRLHGTLFPVNMRPRKLMIDRHTAYHTGCLTREARVRRVARYRVEDPENAFQADYSYMLSDDGLRVEQVPSDDLAVLARKIPTGQV